jgi:hypothetical protein
LVVVGLCLGHDLVVRVEKVLCEASKHVHDSEPCRSACQLVDAPRRDMTRRNSLGFVMTVVARALERGRACQSISTHSKAASMVQCK